MEIANLYESPAREFAFGHIKGMWRDLGRQVGTRTVGLRRIEVAEGHFSTPAHDHGADEEIFFVSARPPRPSARPTSWGLPTCPRSSTAGFVARAKPPGPWRRVSTTSSSRPGGGVPPPTVTPSRRSCS